MIMVKLIIRHEDIRLSVQLSCYVTEIEKRKQSHLSHDGMVGGFDCIAAIARDFTEIIDVTGE
jgi:hypothetical protein